MAELFVNVLQASAMMLAAVPAALLLGLVLKRAPKAFSYAVWCLVFLRLLCPITVETTRALLPSRQAVEQRLEPVLERPLAGQAAPQAAAPAMLANTAPAGPAKVPQASASVPSLLPARRWTVAELLPWPWLAGAAVLLCCALLPWLRLRRTLRTAIRAADGAWESDRIRSPFVLGMLRPRVYLPLGLVGGERQYILAHERAHIRRGDHLVKLAAFAGLALHWFNPLVWLAYWMLCRDMELSCDESVLRRWPEDIRAAYAGSLLRLAARQSGWLTALAFGEGGVKQRVKNALRYRKAAAGVLCAATLAVVCAGGLMMTRQKAEPASAQAMTLYAMDGTYHYWGARQDLSLLPEFSEPAGRIQEAEDAPPNRAQRAAYQRAEFRTGPGEDGLVGEAVYQDWACPMLYVYDEARGAYRSYLKEGADDQRVLLHNGEPAIAWDDTIYWLDPQRRRFETVPQGYEKVGVLQESTAYWRGMPRRNGTGRNIHQAYWQGEIFVGADGQILLLQDRQREGFILFGQRMEDALCATEEMLLEEVTRGIALNDPGIIGRVAPGGVPAGYKWSGGRVKRVEVVQQGSRWTGTLRQSWAKLRVVAEMPAPGMDSDSGNSTSFYCTVRMYHSKGGWAVSDLTSDFDTPATWRLEEAISQLAGQYTEGVRPFDLAACVEKYPQEYAELLELYEKTGRYVREQFEQELVQDDARDYLMENLLRKDEPHPELDPQPPVAWYISSYWER